MNQGRIWCVVSPTVGLPLLLGSVTALSLIVHASVMTHTSWMSNYWQGAKVKTSDNSTGTAPVAMASPQGGYSITVTPSSSAAGTPAAFVVTVTPSDAAATAQTVRTALNDVVPSAGFDQPAGARTVGQ